MKNIDDDILCPFHDVKMNLTHSQENENLQDIPNYLYSHGGVSHFRNDIQVNIAKTFFYECPLGCNFEAKIKDVKITPTGRFFSAK